MKIKYRLNEVCANSSWWFQVDLLKQFRMSFNEKEKKKMGQRYYYISIWFNNQQIASKANSREPLKSEHLSHPATAKQKGKKKITDFSTKYNITSHKTVYFSFILIDTIQAMKI